MLGERKGNTHITLSAMGEKGFIICAFAHLRNHHFQKGGGHPLPISSQRGQKKHLLRPFPSGGQQYRRLRRRPEKRLGSKEKGERQSYCVSIVSRYTENKGRKRKGLSNLLRLIRCKRTRGGACKSEKKPAVEKNRLRPSPGTRRGGRRPVRARRLNRKGDMLYGGGSQSVKGKMKREEGTESFHGGGGERDESPRRTENAKKRKKNASVFIWKKGVFSIAFARPWGENNPILYRNKKRGTSPVK